MDKLDLTKSYFTFRSMMPGTSEEVSVLWGRKIVMNLANGYGMMGTVYLTTDAPLWFNFGLTRAFMFPPSIFVLTRATESDGLLYIGDGCFSARYVNSFIMGDSVCFQKNSTLSALYVYFRIHGV